jgi:pyruvate,orthophosphate dikinase
LIALICFVAAETEKESIKQTKMSSIVKGIMIRTTPDVCSSNNNRLFNGAGNDGRKSTKVQWKNLQLRIRSSTWKGRTTTYQLPIRGQAILTPTTPPTTKKVHLFTFSSFFFLLIICN